jgi:nickel-dependent lactate racemase
MIQAHKGLEMASYACKDGGSIILVAECVDGLGRPDFLKWFESSNSSALEETLRSQYEVNGQTAWSLLTKTERFRVYLISELPHRDVERMRMIPSETLAEALRNVRSYESGFILPRGAGILPRLATVA